MHRRRRRLETIQSRCVVSETTTAVSLSVRTSEQSGVATLISLLQYMLSSPHTSAASPAQHCINHCQLQSKRVVGRSVVRSSGPSVTDLTLSCLLTSRTWQQEGGNRAWAYPTPEPSESLDSWLDAEDGSRTETPGYGMGSWSSADDELETTT